MGTKTIFEHLEGEIKTLRHELESAKAEIVHSNGLLQLQTDYADTLKAINSRLEQVIREAREQEVLGYIPNIESTQKWLEEGYTATLNPKKEGRYVFPVYAAPVPT